MYPSAGTFSGLDQSIFIANAASSRTAYIAIPTSAYNLDTVLQCKEVTDDKCPIGSILTV